MTVTGAAVSMRWSSVRDCPRKAVYETTGVEARGRTDREERILFRGRRLGRDYADMLAAKYGEENIQRERKVAWPLGVGHIDVYLPETKTAVEVLSSAHASDAMQRSKLLQLVGYIEHDPEAENGVLVVLSPSDFTEERTVIVRTSRLYAELVAEMQTRVAAVVAWRAGGEIPGRVCRKPSEAHGHFCLYAQHCFEDWAPPPLEEIAADETLVAAVDEFARAKAAETAAKKQFEALKERREEAQATIEAAELPAGREVQVGPFKVTRTAVTRSPSFEWKKAEAAGRLDPDAFPDFFKAGSSYSIFKAERVEADGDYGPVPF